MINRRMNQFQARYVQQKAQISNTKIFTNMGLLYFLRLNLDMLGFVSRNSEKPKFEKHNQTQTLDKFKCQVIYLKV